MAGKIFLGLLLKRSYSSVFEVNLWGRFSHRSYSTAQKIENVSSTKASFTKSAPLTSKIPTYEQVKSRPELQKRLADMYKQQADDPDFQKVTDYSMKMGLDHLKAHYKK